MLKPIPKVKLPHIVKYASYNGNTGEGDSYSSAVMLNYVKLEERKQYSYNGNGREIIGNALMFYDFTNSNGLNQAPINNSIITYNNKEYHVVDVETLYGDSNKVHHYEVMLK